MNDTSHPEHMSEVQPCCSMWQPAVISKPNQKSCNFLETMLVAT